MKNSRNKKGKIIKKNLLFYCLLSKMKKKKIKFFKKYIQPFLGFLKKMLWKSKIIGIKNKKL